METRTLGQTDLNVTRLGFGGARIGYEDVTPERGRRPSLRPSTSSCATTPGVGESRRMAESE